MTPNLITYVVKIMYDTLTTFNMYKITVNLYNTSNFNGSLSHFMEAIHDYHIFYTFLLLTM